MGSLSLLHELRHSLCLYTKAELINPDEGLFHETSTDIHSDPKTYKQISILYFPSCWLNQTLNNTVSLIPCLFRQPYFPTNEKKADAEWESFQMETPGNQSCHTGGMCQHNVAIIVSTFLSNSKVLAFLRDAVNWCYGMLFTIFCYFLFFIFFCSQLCSLHSLNHSSISYIEGYRQGENASSDSSVA